MSLGTRRFLSYALALVALLILAIVSIWKGADPTLVVAVTGPVVTVALGAIGFGNWHDRSVRMANPPEQPEPPIAPAPPTPEEPPTDPSLPKPEAK